MHAFIRKFLIFIILLVMGSGYICPKQSVVYRQHLFEKDKMPENMFADFSCASARTALEFAYQHSNQILIARETQNAAHGGVLKASSQLLPKVTANVRNQIIDPSDPRREGVGASIDTTIGLFSGFSGVHSLQSAQEEEKFKRYEYIDKRAEVFKNIIESFVRTVIGDKLIKINSKSIEYMQKLLEFVEAQQRLGVKTQADVKITEARLAGAQASFFVSISSKESAKAQFRAIANCDIAHNAKYSGFIKELFALMPKSLPQFIRESLTNNPKILASRHSYNAMKYKLYAAKATLGPNVNGNISYNVFGEEDKKLTVGIGASIPIIDMQIWGDIKTIKHQELSLRRRVDDTVANVKSSCIRYWQEIISLKKSMKALRKQIIAAASGLENYRKSFELGAASTTDVLKAKDQLYDAERKFLDNELKLISALLNLLYIYDKLTPQALNLNINMFLVRQNS